MYRECVPDIVQVKVSVCETYLIVTTDMYLILVDHHMRCVADISWSAGVNQLCMKVAHLQFDRRYGYAIEWITPQCKSNECIRVLLPASYDPCQCELSDIRYDASLRHKTIYMYPKTIVDMYRCTTQNEHIKVILDKSVQTYALLKMVMNHDVAQLIVLLLVEVYRRDYESYCYAMK